MITEFLESYFASASEIAHHFRDVEFSKSLQWVKQGQMGHVARYCLTKSRRTRS